MAVIWAPAAEFPRFSFLGAKENELLELFYAEGRSYREIGLAVGMKVEAVRKALYRARRKIRGRLSTKAL